MHRIDTPTAQVDKFGVGKNGFTRGNPQTGTPATDLDDDYFDSIQEELAGVVEATGVALNKAKRNQLLTALKALLLSRSNPFGDIKADGAVAIATALANLGLGDGSAVPVGVPLPWTLAVPPAGWLKCNGAVFSAALYPKLALAYPTLTLPDLRGVFIRGVDDGRGIDISRVILSYQESTIFGEFIGDSGPGLGPVIRNRDDRTVDTVTGWAVQKGTLGGMATVTYKPTRPVNLAFNYIVRAA